MRATPLLLLLPLALSACDAPSPADEGYDPFADADASLPWRAGPPAMALTLPAFVRPGEINTLTVTGDLGLGERVYFGATTAGLGAGPCIRSAGGLCLDIRQPRLIGTALADDLGTATLAWSAPGGIPIGAEISVQALVVRGIGGVDAFKSTPSTAEASTAPAEGTVIPSWIELDFADNGYRDGCAGGTKYVMSTPYTPARYVGVTLCDAHTYKLWLSDLLYGTFYPIGDWSGAGEDHCEFTGGQFLSFPSGSNAVDPNQPCWSRGPAGASPVFEASCATNRWMPSNIRCTSPVPLPPGLAEGDTLADWTSFNFVDDHYRDGCPGGAKYVKSTGFPTAKYVGVTLCSPTVYKLWMSDLLFGEFHTLGDWSGAGEDHCEFVGGSYVSFPGGSNAVDPGQSCWSRGPFGVEPVYEAICQTNRWVPSSYDCGVALP